MKKSILITFFIFIFSSVVFGSPLSDIERSTNLCLREIKSYVCDVDTMQFENVMKKMTSGMPEDFNRPQKPVLKKYWHNKMGMAIRVEGKNVFPYMREQAKRMSSQFALELSCFFLPMDMKKKRDELIKDAELSVTQQGDFKKVLISFKDKKDIDNVFFKTGLPIPTKDVKGVEILFNNKELLLEGINIIYEKDQINTKVVELSIKYINLEGKKYIDEINILANDGSLKGSFKTEFIKIGKYYLPSKQIRFIEGSNIPEENKKVEVNFKNYKINMKIPKKIFYEQ